MPEAPAAPPPAATPQPVAGPGVGTPGHEVFAPVSQPKPGSAREKLHQALFKQAGVESPKPEKPASPPQSPENPSVPKKGSDDASEAPTEPAAVNKEESEPPEDATPPSPSEKPPEPKKEKVNPWKLLDEHKKRAAQLESELLETRKGARTVEDADRYSKIEARNRELEEEILYTNYVKSKEYQEKYEKPYQDAWSRAMSDLKELTVGDPATGSARPITPDDILQLVNLPLPKAREIANELYGDFADDVMAHRKEIRRIHEEQKARIEDVRKNGLEREKQRRAEMEQSTLKMNANLNKVWSAANSDALTNKGVSPYIREVENDASWNSALEKGTKLFDDAFGMNVRDPKLSDEQREDIVYRHAAIRNRCRAYGPMKVLLQRLQKENADLKTKLGNYKEAEPSGGPRAATPTPGYQSAHDRMMSELGKIAQH